MQEEVFDQNDGSESAAGESGAKKKKRGVLYIISASAVEGRLLVHACSVWLNLRPKRAASSQGSVRTANNYSTAEHDNGYNTLP